MIPWIAEKPWEFAYDAGRQSFLATEEIHFVRNVLTAVPADIIAPCSGPLKILVASAQPVGFGHLSIDQEVEVIRRGFEPLIDAGLIDVEVLARATPAAIHGRLSTGEYTVVHFIGHGGIIAGDAVRHAFERADVVLSVGCRWSSWMWDERGALARRHHRVININIDPSALGQAVVHEVAMQADAGEALRDLLVALGDAPPPGGEWLTEVRAVRQRYELKLALMAADTEETMHPAALAKAVADALPDDALAVYDGGHTTFWSNDFTPVREEAERILANPSRRDALYEELRAKGQSDKQTSAVHRSLLALLRVDPEFNDLHERLNQLDREAARAGRLRFANGEPGLGHRERGGAVSRRAVASRIALRGVRSSESQAGFISSRRRSLRS